MSKFYKLDDNNHPIECSLMEWAEFFELDTRHLLKSVSEDGKTGVSTVFLGIYHMGGMFETMSFSNLPDLNEWQTRCDTYDESVKQHLAMCSKLSDVAQRKLTKTETI